MSATSLFFGKSKTGRWLFGRSARSAMPKPEIATPTDAEALPTGIASASAASVATPKKKILLVDDDAIILKTTSMKLQSHGYAVTTAMDGAAAIQAVRKARPDVILLDLSFPVDAGGGSVLWDGFIIMSWLRRLEETRNIPFIVITGGDPAQYQARSLANGAMAFFHKPLDHDGLLSVIEQTAVTAAENPRAGFDTNFQI